MRNKNNRQMRRIRQQLNQKRHPQAARALRRLLVSTPRHAEALFELAKLSETKPEKALPLYLQALSINQRYADAWYRLGMTYERGGLFNKAVMAFMAYLRLKPEPTTAHIYMRLGHSLDQLNREAAAVEYYLRALALDPENPAVLFSLSHSLQTLGDTDLAVDCLMSIGRMYPARLGLTSLLMGYMLEKQGQFESAMQCYDDALKRQPRQLFWQLKRDLAYPLVPESREEIDGINLRIEAVLEKALFRLRHQPVQMPHQHFYFLGMIHGNIVHTAYHHILPLYQRRLVGELFQRALPKAPPFQIQPRRSRKIHLGIVVASRSVGLSYFYAGATVDRLDPERFEVTYFCQSQNVSSLFNKLNPFHFTGRHMNWQMIPDDLYQAVELIRSKRPDVVYYTEPAWDFSQTIMTLFRTAPVQCTSWMSPGTSGLETMDYFLSSTCMERDDAQNQYSEKLENCVTFPSWIKNIPLPEPVPRSNFGLEDDWVVYSCLQNLMKFHPDFDRVVAEILRRNPKAHLVLLSAKERQGLAERLMNRFEKHIPDVMERIWVFPELSNQDFLLLLQSCDIALDPIYYGGGTTAYQALAAGLPVVTMPGERMVGRITAGLYGLLDINDTVTNSVDEYIDKAVALGADPAWRQDIKQRTQSRLDLIFEDQRAVDFFSDFLERAVKVSRAVLN